jgi:RNA polymerase sigma factor for flagellar operon FliA
VGALLMKDDIWTDFVSTRSPELRDEIILAYTPLVRFVVGRLGIPATSMLDAEDLVSYGLIGLINSVDRYDPARGVRFEAFAMSRIRGAVIDQLRVLNWLPRSAVARVRQIESALANLEQRLGRPAKEQEAAAEVGVSTQRYRQMLLEVGIVVLSLDAPLGSLSQEDEVASLGDLLEDSRSLGPDEQTERTELMNALTVAINHLPERERLLLSLYYHEELTMKEISSLMNVSESRICQLHMQAVLRLRTALNELTIADGTQADRKLRVTSGSSGGMRRTRRHFSSAAS